MDFCEMLKIALKGKNGPRGLFSQYSISYCHSKQDVMGNLGQYHSVAPVGGGGMYICLFKVNKSGKRP